MNQPIREQALAILVLLLVVGSLVLAIIDSSTRATFADLTKVAVGAYIGSRVSTTNQRSSKSSNSQR